MLSWVWLGAVQGYPVMLYLKIEYRKKKKKKNINYFKSVRIDAAWNLHEHNF